MSVGNNTARAMGAKLQYVRNMITKLQGTREIKAWVAWNKLDLSKQISIQKDWDGFYEVVKQSDQYTIFQLLREYIKKGDPKIKDLIQKNREIREENVFIPKPKSFPFDPILLENCSEVRLYKQLADTANSIEISMTGNPDTTLSTQELFVQ